MLKTDQGPETEIRFVSYIKNIGTKLGTLLKIDTHINDTLRGQYARLYVQVNIDKP